MYSLSWIRSKFKIEPREIKYIQISELQKFVKAFIKTGEVELES